ncbi:MAG: LysR family transcriptional regulator [Marinobacter sp.]|nr:LysR family transcriptional regulator [Marinobacter sp.]
MLDRHHLEILRAVDREGSLTAAAAALHLTQSALSHSVKKLERLSGTALWTREGRQLRLTQAGEYLLSLANRLLPQMEHAEAVLAQFAKGKRGMLRIGMECHPCYQWLLKVVGPYLEAWPDVDVDVKQEFQFGGIGALFGHDIDLLVTPDPLRRPGLIFEPVFDYEQVLVVSRGHKLADQDFVLPEELERETLITYPVELERLDIYTRFFLPAQRAPARHKTIETTDILLQMVASGRGVSALPGWMVAEYGHRLPVVPVRLGVEGIHKQIFLGLRERDRRVDYLTSFMNLAREVRWR